MRARYPDAEGFIERGGVKVGYEVLGEGQPAVVFAPTDVLVHSRVWKAQVPYLARTFRVVTIDPRGNGRSDRPQSAGGYADTEFAADTIAVMDATGIDQAVLVGICSGAWTAFLAAALHPGRVLGIVNISTWAPFLTPPLPWRAVYDFDTVPDAEEAWAKDTRHYWLRDWRGYAEFFFGELLSEPHSTKQLEDCVGWVMESTAEANLLSRDAPLSSSCREETEAILARVSCPVLAIHGREDRCQPWQRGEQQIARFPSLRDRAVFVGNPDDVVPDAFGEGLPPIRDWVEQNYQFSGYVSGIAPADLADREAIRAELGYQADEMVCVVTVGGSGVGADLLRRVTAAFPAARRLVPGLRMIVVTGPRIDPASLPSGDGLELHGYVHDLYRHLAACDLAVVQGGLTTTMELTASQRPFIYVPLRHHFEQNFHVRHRLARYGAGRCLHYEETVPDMLARAMADEVTRPVSYRPVETDGAARAAECLAELI